MYAKLVIRKQIVNIVGLSAEEKDDLWDNFIMVLFRIPKQDRILIGSDLNGHVGREAEEMTDKNDDVTKADYVQKKWLLMKETWLKGSK